MVGKPGRKKKEGNKEKRKERRKGEEERGWREEERRVKEKGEGEERGTMAKFRPRLKIAIILPLNISCRQSLECA